MEPGEFYGSFWHWFWTLVCALPILALIAVGLWWSATQGWDTTFDDRTFDDDKE